MKTSKKTSQVKLDRINTGVPGFDSLVEGGLVKGSTTLLIGGAGVGKSTFAMQFLCEGAKKDEPGLYVTLEQDLDSIRGSAARFGMNLAEYERKGLISLVEVDPSKIMNLVKEGYGQIVEEINKMSATRVVIDSITAFEAMVQDDFERRRNIFKFTKWLQTHNCTTVMTAEVEQDINATRTPDVSEFVADGVVLMYAVLQKNLRRRALEVLKMRETKLVSKICLLKFEKQGIAVHCDKSTKKL